MNGDRHFAGSGWGALEGATSPRRSRGSRSPRIPGEVDAARSVRERADLSAQIGLEGAFELRREAFAESRQVGEGVVAHAVNSPFIRRGRSRSRACVSCRLWSAKLRNWLHVGVTIALNISNIAGGGILNSNPRRCLQSALGIFELSLMVFDAKATNSSLDRRNNKRQYKLFPCQLHNISIQTCVRCTKHGVFRPKQRVAQVHCQ